MIYDCVPGPSINYEDCIGEIQQLIICQVFNPSNIYLFKLITCRGSIYFLYVQ